MFTPAAAASLQYVFIHRAPGYRAPDGIEWNQDKPESFTPEGFRRMVGKVGSRGAGNLRLGAAFSFSILETDTDILAESVRRLLGASEEADVPVLICFDGQNWWTRRPDLWNWWDEGVPGFSLENRWNVEWFGWGPEFAVRGGWRNWGSQIRVPPAPNLASPRFRAEHTERLEVLVPVVRDWFEGLPEGKRYLFGGVKVGWEACPHVNAYFHKGGNEILERFPDDSAHDPTEIDKGAGPSFGGELLGYAAATTLGIKSSGELTVGDLSVITRDYLAFLAKTVSKLGIPTDRIFTHQGGTYPPWEKHLSFSPAINEWSVPGWSFYDADPAEAGSLAEDMERAGREEWCAAEWWRPGRDQAEWEDRLEKALDFRDCRFVCIYNWHCGGHLSENSYALNAIQNILNRARPSYRMGQERERRTQHLLRDFTHGFCPYSLPYETNREEILRVADQGYEVIGVLFCGPWDRGDIDWTSLDELLGILEARGQRVLLHVAPRFAQGEGVFDILNTGRRIEHRHDRNPNYAMLDIFDPSQRRLYYAYLETAARRYGQDPRVAGFCFCWGYQGETGFYNGDFNTDFCLLGSECAGYSPWALFEFNRDREARGVELLEALPQPRTDFQTDEYIDWMRFRYRYVGEVFQRGAADAIRAVSEKPVGTQGYLPASVENYARAWTFTPNVDFFRSAGITDSFGMERTLIDSGIGWEDAWLHDGHWDHSFACMMRDEVRQIARGGAFHGMWVRLYEQQPQWEESLYERVSRFLINQKVESFVVPEPPTVALFQPTWATAVLPGRSPETPFLPSVGARWYAAKMTGLAESFGVPYCHVVEEDLLETPRLAGFRHILVPMADLVCRFLGEEAASELLEDPRVIPIPFVDRALSRSEMRAILEESGVSIRLDYEGERILFGRTHNVIYNWDNASHTCVVEGHPFDLGPHGVVFLLPSGEIRGLDTGSP